MGEDEETVLIFPGPSEAGTEAMEESLAKEFEAFGKPKLRGMRARVSDLVKWFKGYKVDSIELWLEGVVKTGKLTGLVISAEGKGGVKVILKP